MKYRFLMLVKYYHRIWSYVRVVPKTPYKRIKKDIKCKPRLQLSKGQLRHF